MEEYRCYACGKPLTEETVKWTQSVPNVPFCADNPICEYTAEVS